MPSLRSRTFTWIALSALAWLGLGVGSVMLVRRSLPQIAGAVRVAGLHGRVTVARDAWGVPHLYASDAHDLFAAQGYITAQDRLWQMLLRRQAARSQLSAWLGASASQADDILSQQEFVAQADEILGALKPDTRTVFDAYALGVNACLASCPAPPELTLLQRQGKTVRIEPWMAQDSIALSQMLLWAQSQQSDARLALTLSQTLGAERFDSLWTEGDAPLAPSLPADPALRRTVRWIGLPLWRDEPSRAASAPGLPAAWYMMSLHSDGPTVKGGTWPGVPGIMVDHAAGVSDAFAPGADEASALVASLLELPPEGWLQARVHGMLRQWDCNLSGGARLSNASAAVYQVWVWHLARDTFQDELGSDLFNRYWATMRAPRALARLVERPGDPWWDDVTTPQVETRDDVIRRSYAEALEYLGRHYGDLHTIWEWDAMHAAQFLHSLGAWPWSFLLDRTTKLGGNAPFDPAQPDDPLNAYAPTLLPSLRITDQGFELAGGQSGHPFSPHYADLLPLWARNQSVPLQDAARAQDLRDVEGVLTLAP
jgi:acyl-homoserine lactone acylase PvdQ